MKLVNGKRVSGIFLKLRSMDQLKGIVYLCLLNFNTAQG